MPKITENWAKMVIFSEAENKTIGTRQYTKCKYQIQSTKYKVQSTRVQEYKSTKRPFFMCFVFIFIFCILNDRPKCDENPRTAVIRHLLSYCWRIFEFAVTYVARGTAVEEHSAKTREIRIVLSVITC